MLSNRYIKTLAEVLIGLLNPVDTGRKLNVHKTFNLRLGRLLNVLCTFNLRPASTGKIVITLRITRYK